MNDASGAVTPAEAEVIQAGDATWQRAMRRGLAQGAVPGLVPFECARRCGAGR